MIVIHNIDTIKSATDKILVTLFNFPTPELRLLFILKGDNNLPPFNN